MRYKSFGDGRLILPDNLDSAFESLRFMLDDPEATVPPSNGKQRGTQVQDHVDVLLTPQIIGTGEKAFRDVDGRLEFDIVLSGTKTDRDGEYVAQETLAEQWEAYRRNPVVMYMHSWMDGVANIVEFWQDSPSSSGVQQSYGTVRMGRDFHYQFNGVLYHIDDLNAKIRQFIIRSCSIAFNAKRIVEEEGAPRLELTDWYETSMVTIPSYRDAQIVHRMFESFRGNEKLPANFAMLLYGGIDPGQEQPYERIEPKHVTTQKNPEGWTDADDETLRDIVQSLDVGFNRSTPAPRSAEADGKALLAVLADIEQTSRGDWNHAR